MGKTYLTGKIGKSVKFHEKNWSSIGGDCEAPALIRKIAELNPNDTFIIITKNDLGRNRIELNLPKNLLDVYDGATKEERNDNMYVYNRLKDVKIDGCFLMTGPTSNCNIPNKSWKRNDLKKGIKVYAKALMTFENYVAPVYNFLNESNIPWVLIANDPRYIAQGYDLMNQPKHILSQYDETVLMQTYDNWEDQNYVKNEINAKYAGMEKIFLIDKELPKITKKTKAFSIILNEGNNGVKSRYPMLKEYVLDYFDNVEVYGKWSDEIIEKDKRFKGSLPFTELQQMLCDIKYTFIIPIKPGWSTMKWAEMVVKGVIPFFSPTYDEQKHVPIPDFCRIEKPNQLRDKIEYLENNPDQYKKIFNECLDIITENDLNGINLSNTILSNTPPVNKVGKEFLQTLTQKETNRNECLDAW